MLAIRTKKLTPKEQRITKAINEIYNSTLKNVTIAANVANSVNRGVGL
jgi:hypothetical protein